MIGFDGKMTAEAGPAYAGLERAAARKKVLVDLASWGFGETTSLTPPPSGAASAATPSSSRSSRSSGS